MVVDAFLEERGTRNNKGHKEKKKHDSLVFSLSFSVLFSSCIANQGYEGDHGDKQKNINKQEGFALYSVVQQTISTIQYLSLSPVPYLLGRWRDAF